MKKNKFIPLLINLNDKRVLIVGGGKVALLKAKGVCRFTTEITILAPEIRTELLNYSFNFIRERYDPKRLEFYDIVYACTDNYKLNQEIALACKKAGKLYSICDNPSDSLFASPAIYKEENVTIAIGTNGCSPKRAIYIRNQIKALVEQGVLNLELNEYE